MGGISEHFIWHIDLVEHFIWKVDLILWLFWMGSHWRHRWGNSWSAVTGSFMGGYIWIWTLHLKIWTHIWCPCALHLVHFIWQLWGVYLTAYLGISSENMNSYLMSLCMSSCSLHLTTMGGISDTLSGHFIWKYELISSFQIWVSVCTSSEHFIWTWGGISDSFSEHFISKN